MNTESQNRTRRVFLRTTSGAIAGALVATHLTLTQSQAAETKRDGSSFVVTLSHSDVDKLNTAGGVASGLAPEIAPIIGAVLGIITTVDGVSRLTGGAGVEISGAIGSSYLLILPQGKGIFGTIIKAVGEVANFLVNLQPNVILAKFGMKVLTVAFGSAGGEIHADEKEAKDEETFVMITTTDKKVAFFSNRGYFRANKDDKLVWADRDKIGSDEKFDLIDNGNGTVSFRSMMGTYLSADDKLDKQRISANRTKIDVNERFKLEFLGSGKVAIKAHDGNYLSVAP